MKFRILTLFSFILISVYAPLRASAGEHSLYDNLLVTTVGHSFAVNPADALSVTWGKLKMR